MRKPWDWSWGAGEIYNELSVQKAEATVAADSVGAWVVEDVKKIDQRVLVLGHHIQPY